MELYQTELLHDVVIDIVLGDEEAALKKLTQNFTGSEMVDVHNIYFTLDKLAQMVWTLKGEPDAERLQR